MSDLTEAKCQMDVMLDEIQNLKALVVLMEIERDAYREALEAILAHVKEKRTNARTRPALIKEIAESVLAGGKR